MIFNQKKKKEKKKINRWTYLNEEHKRNWMMDNKKSITPGRLYIIAIFIIIIVIIKNQLYQEDYMSTGLKTLISVSTVFLLLLIVAYHMLEIQVYLFL